MPSDMAAVEPVRVDRDRRREATGEQVRSLRSIVSLNGAAMNKISVRGILLRASILLVTCLSTVSTLSAQYESLNPRSWFPLEAGNAWSYQLDLFDKWTVVSTIDTNVIDLSWRKFQVVECAGPDCPRKDYWQALSADDYPLRTDDFVRIDTLVRSRPKSVFRTTVANDTMVTVWCPSGWDGEVGIHEEGPGTAEDSTNLVLVVQPSNIFCDGGTFVYRIGYSGFQQLRLIGAIVNGLEWGNAEPLRRLLSAETETIPSHPISLEAYPNPAHGRLTVEMLVSKSGVYDLTIEALTGQTIVYEQVFMVAGLRNSMTIPLVGLNSGLYIVHATNGALSQRRGVIVLD